MVKLAVVSINTYETAIEQLYIMEGREREKGRGREKDGEKQ